MRRGAAFISGTMLGQATSAPADGATGSGINAIFSDPSDAARSWQVERNWQAMVEELRQPVEATLRGGMSAGDIAYRLGALVHGFFRSRGVTLASAELRRVVIALLENHRRGWPAPSAPSAKRSAEDVTSASSLRSDGLVAFVDRPPQVASPRTVGWSADSSESKRAVMTPDVPSSLVSVDPGPMARMASTDGSTQAGPPGAMITTAPQPSSRQRSSQATAHIVDAPDVVRLSAEAATPAAARDADGQGRAAAVPYTGLEPLADLMRDDSVTAIYVDGPHSVFVERAGRRERADVAFADSRQLDDLVKALSARVIAAPGVSRSAVIDVPLDDGSRVIVLTPPLAPSGPHLVVRRPAAAVTGLDGLVGEGMLSPLMAQTLRSALRARLNLLICGGDALDNAAMLSAVVQQLPTDERIVSLARAVPIQPARPNHLGLVVADRTAVAARDALAAAAMLQADRLVVDDVVADVVPDLLRTATGGTDVIVARAVATPAEAFEQWAQALRTADPALSVAAARRRLAWAFRLVLHVERVRGVRRVARMASVAADDDPPRLDDLFIYDERAGRFIATGRHSRVLESDANA